MLEDIENTQEQDLQTTATPTVTEGAQQPEQPSPDTGPEQKPEETPQPEKPKGQWVQKRIGQLTRERYEERQRAEALQRQLDEARGYETQNPVQVKPQDVELLVREQAQQIVKAQEFDKACNTAYAAGTKEFQNFDESLRMLAALGAVTPDVLGDITSLENSHRVLHYLGQNPDEAAEILSLSPFKRGAALAKLEAATKPAPVSKAPPPPNPISGNATQQIDPSNMTDAEWFAASRR